MANEQTHLQSKGEGPRNPFVLGILSFLVGTVAGLLGSIFRIALRQLDVWRTTWIDKTQHWGWGGIVVVVTGTAIAAALAAWMVRTISPESTGPQSESEFPGCFSR